VSALLPGMVMKKGTGPVILSEAKNPCILESIKFRDPSSPAAPQDDRRMVFSSSCLSENIKDMPTTITFRSDPETERIL